MTEDAARNEMTMGMIFPNETPAYREARRELLAREVALRREMEAVAAEIRALPPGGEIPEDYEFDHIGADGAPAKVRLSELFRPGTDALIVYHYMFPRHLNDQTASPEQRSGSRAAAGGRAMPVLYGAARQLGTAGRAPRRGAGREHCRGGQGSNRAGRGLP